MDIPALLAQTRLFSGLPEDALEQLASLAQPRRYASGETVYEAGSAADGLYLVAAGRLRASEPGGAPIVDIGRFESVGEVGLLSGAPHRTQVYAIRDSELLLFERQRLLDFLLRHPASLLELSRAVIRRLLQRPRDAELDHVRLPRSLTLLPASPQIDLRDFASQLHLALSECGHTLLLDAERIDAALGAGCAGSPVCDGLEQGELVHYLLELETAHRHLVYVADRYPTLWSQRCLRQADRVLVVADARRAPQPSPTLDELRRSGIRAAIDLVLLRPESVAAGEVLGWRERVQAQSHYFMRPGNAADAGRIARSLTGRGVGLVLGGGGARGFAHLGLLRALEELQIPIDVIGGSSMGAFLAALTACGFNAAEATRISRQTFVDRNLLNDFLLPRISLLRGRKFVNALRELFGERRVEDLRLPYFCVSTNLTRGRAEVHDRGPLSLWVATSMAVPGVAAPVAWRGDLLVDGAVINSLPTDIMQKLGRGPIIASDVSTEGALGAPPEIEGPDPEALFRIPAAPGGAGRRATLFSILVRTATLASEAGIEQAAARATTYLRMPVSGVELFDWKKLDEVAQRGYEHAMNRLADFRRTLMQS